jgi:xylan 1,4-beta-xylosidase
VGSCREEFQWLRSPDTERLFRVNNGSLSLYGRESMGSWFEQALVARRQEHFVYTAETEVAFDPVTYQQTAGLTTYYNRFKFHMLLVTDEPGQGRSLTIISCLGDFPDGNMSFALDKPIRARTARSR